MWRRCRTRHSRAGEVAWCILHMSGTEKMEIPTDRAMYALIITLLLGGGVMALAQLGAPAATPAADPRAFLDRHCVACHNQKLRTAGLALDSLNVSKPSSEADLWERVIAKLRAGS